MILFIDTNQYNALVSFNQNIGSISSSFDVRLEKVFLIFMFSINTPSNNNMLRVNQIMVIFDNEMMLFLKL